MFNDVTIQCIRCKSPVVLRIAQPVINNLVTVSVICIQHTGPVACGACGQLHVPAIGKLGGIAFMGVPVSPEASPKMVVPASMIPS